MNEISFSAQRAAATTRPEPDAAEARFRALVQSPLRAGLVRFLNAQPNEAFDVESLMATFGRMRLDVENCLKELVDFGVARRLADRPTHFAAARPERAGIANQLDAFLERRAAISTEDQSPSVQRFREMIGRDEKMLIVFEWIRTAAKSGISVLILGPTGSGKEVVARMIHELSARSRENFQAVNCAALSDTLFESEIFGYEKGAFTGAVDRKPGRVELADRGTLFLDEIGEMTPATQVKLLRVLQERSFRRLGGRTEQTVDVRVIAATNVDPVEAVKLGKLREDLYYRLNVFAFRLPTLRERKDDLPLLVQAFIAEFNQRNQKAIAGVDQAAMRMIEHYAWPGNVRELRNVIERATILAPGPFIEPRHLPPALTDEPPVPQQPQLALAPGTTVEEAERRLIVMTLAHTRDNKTRAAEILGISLKTLHNKLNKLRLRPKKSE